MRDGSVISRRAALAMVGAAGLMPRAALGQADKASFLRNSIALEDGRVFIAALIKGQGPYLFIVDTGGTLSFIEDSFAKSIKLEPVAQSRLKGVGGINDSTFYNAGEVAFASGIRFADMLFAGIRTRPSKDAVGSFGAGLFTSYDSDLDFVKGEWRAYPKGRPDFAGLTRVESRFIEEGRGAERIYADATIDGFKSEYMLDTGAPENITLDAQAARSSGLWRDDRPYVPMRGHGIGRGEVPMRLVRADKLSFGPIADDKPLVTLRAPGTANARAGGVIGLIMLERLHLTTQVKSRSVWASINGRPPRAERYGMSGLWVDGDDLVVADVGTGSPASEAGIKTGDKIVGTDFRTLLTKIMGKPGSEVALSYERGGQRKDASFTLKPYL